MYIDQKDVKFTIRALPENNGWALCIVQVEAQYMGLTAVEYLYDTPENNLADGAFDQMKRLCIDSLCKQIEQIEKGAFYG